MKRTGIIIILAAVVVTLCFVSWVLGVNPSNDKASANPGIIFGIEPWENKDSVIAKNIVAGIESMELNDEKAVFNDLVDRLFSTRPPARVVYHFANERVYRMELTFTGASKPYRAYLDYFTKIYGQPTFERSGANMEVSWTTGSFLLRISSNHEAEMARQLREQINESEKIVVSIDIIFTGKSN